MTSKFKLYERIVLDNIEFTITNISVIPQCAQYIDKKFVYLFDFNYSLSYGDYKVTYRAPLNDAHSPIRCRRTYELEWFDVFCIPTES